MLSLVLAVAQAAALGATQCTPPPLRQAPVPFRSGERLAYDLEILFVAAGRLSLQVDRPLSGGVLPLKGRAQGTTTLASLRKITAVALSWIDSESLRPERYHEEADEDGRRRSTDVRFPPGAEAATLDQRWRGQRSPRTFPLQGVPLDALSALYLLRAARLEPGERFCFDMVAAGRFWRISGALAPGREEVQSPAGRFETIRVDAEAARADLPPGAPGRIRPLHVWLTADERRLPVSMVGEIDVGPVSATLSSWRAPPAP